MRTRRRLTRFSRSLHRRRPRAERATEEARSRRRGIVARLHDRRDPSGRADRAAADLIRQRWAQAALATADVRLDVRAGTASLHGRVAGRAERRQVEAAAQVPGVSRVESHLVESHLTEESGRVDPPEPPGPPELVRSS